MPTNQIYTTARQGELFYTRAPNSDAAREAFAAAGLAGKVGGPLEEDGAPRYTREQTLVDATYVEPVRVPGVPERVEDPDTADLGGE